LCRFAEEKGVTLIIIGQSKRSWWKRLLGGSVVDRLIHNPLGIDVLVVSPAFDSDRWSRDQELWRLTLEVDPRIEPVPVGQRQLLEDRTSPIVEIARREGIEIDGDEK
ncbi:MAG: universal stress protein, partial [candidate division NC10 bacterium]